MHHALRPIRQTQYHIMILASVELGAEQLGTVQQFPGKHTEMTDIVIGPQIINGIIRLKMHGNHLIDIAIFEGGFITVDIIRIFSLIAFTYS